MGAVGRDRLLPTSGAQVLDGLALPGVALAAVLRELDGESAAGERSECAARVDRGQLAVVSDQDELAARRLDVIQQSGELARPGHAGLVDDEDDPAREPLAEFEAGDQLGEADRRDRRLGLQLPRGVTGDGGAENREARAGPRLVGRRERERLSCARAAKDDRDRRRFARASSVRPSTATPAGWRSQSASITARRVKEDSRAVRPSEPKSSATTSATDGSSSERDGMLLDRTTTVLSSKLSFAARSRRPYSSNSSPRPRRDHAMEHLSTRGSDP